MNADSQVTVYGMPDVIDYVCDFKVHCTLAESVNIIKEKWASMSDDDKKLYQFSVLDAFTNSLIYEFYLDKAVIPEVLMDIVKF